MKHADIIIWLVIGISGGGIVKAFSPGGGIRRSIALPVAGFLGALFCGMWGNMASGAPAGTVSSLSLGVATLGAFIFPALYLVVTTRSNISQWKPPQ
jgi:hypothetical protein